MAVSLDRTPSPDTLTVYVDGVLATSTIGNLDGQATTWGSNTRIGTTYWAGGTGDREGSMDDVRIYNRTISADEVTQLYSMGR